MRNILSPQLPGTEEIRDIPIKEYLNNLNTELDNLRIDINRFVGTLVTRAITSSATLKAGDELILCNGTFTVTLPLVTSLLGKVYTIKNTGTGTITIDGNNSETIDGQATASLSSQYDFITILSDKSSWHIVAS